MAFDAGMAAAVCRELSEALVGAKVEKVYQPSGDELVFACRRRGESRRLLLSASPQAARVCMTELVKENPKTPPMFCMQLRKHLVGAVITDVCTHGFERVVEIAFDTYDEMGFACKKYLEAEIMGKYSNLVFVGEREDGEKRVLGALRAVDFTTSSRRQVLAGMKYELPPKQDKLDPTAETEAHFSEALAAFPPEKTAEKFLLDTYQGLSPLASREIADRAACLRTGVGEIASATALWRSLARFLLDLSVGNVTPLVLSRQDGTMDTPFEFCFFDVAQYGNTVKKTDYPTFSAMFDAFYGAREQAAAMKSRSLDMEKVITAARHKLAKKIPQQETELAACEEMDTFKLWGDLITASVYMLTKKAPFCEVPNYYSETMEIVRIPLDVKLTPSQNAARYYKKYAKLKTAKGILTEQIEKAREELIYLASVEEALSRAENENDLADIRRELTMAGYLSSAKTGKGPAKKESPTPTAFRTAGGRLFYVGRNNIQNDYLTTKLAGKSDWWFHVKGGHGSHVIMLCDAEEDPDAADFTEAAAAAAYYSEMRGGEKVPVDYTQIKNVKKPSGAMPGKVVYYTNYTAYVDPKKPERSEK